MQLPRDQGQMKATVNTFVAPQIKHPFEGRPLCDHFVTVEWAQLEGTQIDYWTGSRPSVFSAFSLSLRDDNAG